MNTLVASRASEEVTFTVTECRLGRVLIASGARGVCAVLLGDDDAALERELRARFPRVDLEADPDDSAGVAADVRASLESPGRQPSVPLDLRGTAFQRRVWRALREIPAGRTVSYTALARSLGRPRSARAVAGACAANPLAVLIPCHRAVREDGALSGYRWGVERKRRLLELETAS